MPRYFFDVRDGGGTLVDDDGMELPNLECAVLEARKALHEMEKDNPSPSNSAVVIEVREGERSITTVVATTSIVPNTLA